MERRRRTTLARGLAALAAVAVAVTAAIALADRSSPERIDAPNGGLPDPAAEPLPEIEIFVDEPRGEPRGLVWAICCGGWRPPEAYDIDLADRGDRRALGVFEWTRRGYLVASFGARGRDTAVEEATAAYDRLRRRYPDLEVCAVGSSAAGHMALMTAARRPRLSCVAAHSAPTALADLPRRAVPGVLDHPPLALATEIFGPGTLEELSPLTHAADIRAAVRLAACSDDRVVPAEQSRRMASALRRGQAERVVLDVTQGESALGAERPRRGWTHLLHDCYATPGRARRDQQGLIEFVEAELAED